MAEEPKNEEKEREALAPHDDPAVVCADLAAAIADEWSGTEGKWDDGWNDDAAVALQALSLHRIACALEALQTEATEVLIEDAVGLGPMAPTAVATLTRGAKPRGG